jgi:cobalt-zinc-cadmium efflux system outer membrane protein
MKQPFIVLWCRQSAVAALVLGLSLPLTRAQDAPPTNTVASAAVATTLDALVTEALEKNPELKFYAAEITAAKAGRKTAGQLGNPEVSGGVGQKRVSSPGLSDEGIAWSVSVVQPLEWPGRIGLRKAIANRDIELAQLGYERFKVALAGRVRTLAYGLFAAQEKAAASGEVAERFKALREVLVQRDPAGLTPLLETRVIEATELNAQRKASEAMLATQAALLELNLLRGVAPETRLVVGQAQLSFRPPEERRSLLSLAQTNNFELRMRAVELAQQGFRVKLAKNERYSSLAIGPEYSEEKVGNDREQIIGVSVSMSLPLWDRNGGNIEAAKARQMQAEVSLNVTERDIQRQVLAAALTYETKLREMAKWRPDSVQHFKEAAELADRHYRLGAVPISVYVELQQQYLDAVDGLLETKRETLEAAAQLELLTGLPLPLAKTSAPEEVK